MLIDSTLVHLYKYFFFFLWIHGKLVNNYNGACNIFILVKKKNLFKKKSNVNCGGE